MHALLLAAGFGSRLKALSEQRPKPLLPVCNQPLIRWGLAWLAEHGQVQATINLHHMAEMFVEELGEQAEGVALSYAFEREQILGTGGGVKQMAAQLDRDRLLIANAKLVSEVDLGRLLERHIASGAVATMVVRPTTSAAWRSIGVDASSGMIARLVEVTAPNRRSSSEYMFSGIHIVEPELVDLIPAGPQCIIRTAYQELLRRGAPIAAFIDEGYFAENSTAERYLRTNLELTSATFALNRRLPGPQSGVHPTAEVASTARVSAAALIGPQAIIEADAQIGPRAVIGRGARVASGCRVENSVIWPGASLAQSVDHAIVTPGGIAQLDRQAVADSCDG
ncbi:MAG: NDP-sugar synthase [Deltaproteobacteria bacterium]|nr:NDP-sugar synthase [Deltaproteobacteria bacterium]